MNKTVKLIIVIVLLAAIAGVAMVKKAQKNTNVPAAEVNKPSTMMTDVNKPAATKQANLPRLVDLGADKCIPCKRMAPILEELKELYRHEGFFSKEDILGKWKEFGVDLGGPK